MGLSTLIYTVSVSILQLTRLNSPVGSNSTDLVEISVEEPIQIRCIYSIYI